MIVYYAESDTFLRILSWKARQKEKREELRAEKAASQAVEPTVETQPDAV